MNETSDIVRDCENGFEPFRIFILANAVIAIPLSLLVLYLIIVKSPKHLNRYKYILLNIWVWVFVTDMLLEVIFVPIPLMDIFSFYATGLVQYLDPSVGFWCFVAGVFCVCESLISVLFAFFYRYRSLKHDFQLFGRPVRRMHYIIGIILLFHISSSCPAFKITGHTNCVTTGSAGRSTLN
ncbi:hypothetical protein QR680_015577 [Steinernema hermaphroditum]|uniref:Uncharacterized protein n=1 Tax=Steinernema hermaphroditum TaxID=289476 RepID=A0AA39H9C2_9BILA|nr:hypothetical protein QR680_015577 [Steinernema hermaphroditum]